MKERHSFSELQVKEIINEHVGGVADYANQRIEELKAALEVLSRKYASLYSIAHCCPIPDEQRIVKDATRQARHNLKRKKNNDRTK